MYLRLISPSLKTIVPLLAVILMLSGVASAAVTRIVAPVAPQAVPVAHNAPSIEKVLENIDASFANITDITGMVDVEQVQVDGSIMEALVKVEAKMNGVVRMTFLAPETFADSIFVFDKRSNRAIQYSPITGQAIEQSIDRVLTDASVFTSVDQIFSLPSPDEYLLAVTGTEKRESRELVVVSARHKLNPDSMQYIFSINQETWLVDTLKVLDAKGKLQFTIGLRNIQLNLKLEDSTLKRMPRGTQMIYL